MLPSPGHKATGPGFLYSTHKHWSAYSKNQGEYSLDCPEAKDRIVICICSWQKINTFGAGRPAETPWTLRWEQPIRKHTSTHTKGKLWPQNTLIAQQRANHGIITTANLTHSKLLSICLFPVMRGCLWILSLSHRYRVARAHTHMHTRARMRAHALTHTHTLTHSHTHTHTDTHTLTQIHTHSHNRH